MNWDVIEGKWKEYRGKAQQEWGRLTEDDLDRAKGRRTELAGLVQQRYGLEREEAERQVDEWIARH